MIDANTTLILERIAISLEYMSGRNRHKPVTHSGKLTFGERLVEKILDHHQSYVEGEISHDEWEQGQKDLATTINLKIKAGE